MSKSQEVGAKTVPALAEGEGAPDTLTHQVSGRQIIKGGGVKKKKEKEEVVRGNESTEDLTALRLPRGGTKDSPLLFLLPLLGPLSRPLSQPLSRSLGSSKTV